MKMVIKSGKSLGKFLDAVFEESSRAAMYQRSLQEKEKQQKSASTTSADDVDLFSDSGESNSGEKEKPTSSKTMDDETQKLKKGEISADDIIEKLNSIRSGKSFKDSTVNKSMEEYVDSLSTAEKTALLAFLKGIAQLVTGEISGRDAMEPETNPSNVDMQKQASVQKKTVKPNVIKDTSPQKSVKRNDVENTTPPAPITPKKK